MSLCSRRVFAALALLPVLCLSSAFAQGGQTEDDVYVGVKRQFGKVNLERRAALQKRHEGVTVNVTPRGDLDKLTPDDLAKGAILAEFEVRGSGRASDSAGNWAATLPDGRHTLFVRREGAEYVGYFLMDGKTRVARSRGRLHQERSAPDSPRIDLNLATVVKGRGPTPARKKVVVRTCVRILGFNVFCIETTKTISTGGGEEDEEW